MSQINRRHAMTLAAGLPALAVPSLAATSPPDPTFAAIERHRAAWAELVAGPDPDDDAQQHEWGQLFDALVAAEDAFLEVVPTSIAGVAALLDYYAEIDRDDVGLGARANFHSALLKHLAKALPLIAGRDGAGMMA